MTDNERKLIQESFINQMSERAFVLRATNVNKDTASCKAIIASEDPVKVIDWERWQIVDEIILMSGMTLPKDREQVPLLDTHDRNSIESIIGHAKEFTVKETTLEATTYFSTTTELGINAFALVSEGHLTDLSVGFIPKTKTWIPEGESTVIGGRTFTGPLLVVSEWELKELSYCPIGADVNAVTKSIRNKQGLEEILKANNISLAGTDEEILTQMRNLITPKQTTISLKGDKTMNEEEIRAAEEKARSAERQRIADLDKVRSQFVGKIANINEIHAECVRNGSSVAEMKGIVADAYAVSNPGDAALDGKGMLGLSEKDMNQFSITRAILAILNNKPETAEHEMRISEAVAKKMGRPAGSGNTRGFFIPFDIAMKKRAMTLQLAQRAQELGLNTRTLTAGSSTAGGTLVGTYLDSANFIDMLYNETAFASLGARVLTGLDQNVTIPKKTGKSTFYHAASEGTAPTASQLTTGSVSLSPKIGGTSSTYTHLLMLQSNPSIDALVMEDLFMTCMLGMDYNAYHGAGSTAPTGIVGISGIGDVVGTDLNYETLIEFLKKVWTANANMANCAFVYNPTVWSILRSRFVNATSDQRLVNSDLTIEGRPSKVTNQIDNGYIFYGDHSQGIMGIWGDGINILVDPYTNAAGGNVVVRALVGYDIGLRIAGAFAVSDDVS